MGKEIPLADRLSSAVKTSAFIADLQLSIYSSILTINSVLIGATGIVLSVNSKINISEIYWYFLALILPILFIFSNYIFLRGNSVKNIIKTINEASEAYPESKEYFEDFFKNINNVYYAKTPQQIIKNLENISCALTIINIIVFLALIYVTRY